MIIFELCFTYFELSVIFWDSWGNIKTLLVPEIQPP